jgi:hypothetical protein
MPAPDRFFVVGVCSFTKFGVGTCSFPNAIAEVFDTSRLRLSARAAASFV